MSRVRKLFSVVSVAVFLLWSPNLPAAAPLADFEAANKLYEEGKFTEAAQAYETLLKNGTRSAAVYFNLGNAFFKSSQLGRAIAAYRTAENLSPRDPDIRANLLFARNQAQGPSAPRGPVVRWLSQLTLNEWTVACSASLSLLLFCFIALQWRSELRNALRWPVTFLGVCTVLTSMCLAAAWHLEHSQHMAVVIVGQAEIKHGPLDESQAAFIAHDGSELVILDTKDQWIQVSAGQRRIGWIKRDQVLIGPAA